MTKMNKCYSELIQIDSFEKRFEYLKLDGNVGEDTFGFERYLNQYFYTSPEWKRVRDIVILRDNGCDLGVEGHEIGGRIIIHHMNPITKHDIVHREDDILNPEYLICVSHRTHNAIHYGSLPIEEHMVERKPGDTCPWKKVTS